MVSKSQKLSANKFPVGANLHNMPYDGLTGEELGQVYGYLMLAFGETHPKTRLVIDELNDRCAPSQRHGYIPGSGCSCYYDSDRDYVPDDDDYSDPAMDI